MILSDREIVERVEAEHMIDPFVDHQVSDGVVSYGLSSYGYDFRVANEFKVFSNVNYTAVDPKNFDPAGFVDVVTDDYCVIPPNSFVLARTVEYFRIPRDILTITMGKCVTGDTRVVDAETGAYVPISEFTGRRTLGMDGWQVRGVSVSAFLSQGRKPVYELTTRTGLKIRATANHPFRQLGGWTSLVDLVSGDRIAVARHIPIFGKTPLPDWEAILLGLMISEGQCHTPGHSPVFSSADPVLVSLVERCVREGLSGEVSPKSSHGYRLVNKRGRGGKMTKNRVALWLKKYGLNVTASDKFVPQVIFTAPKETVALFLRALFSGDGSIYLNGPGGVALEYYSNSRRLIEDVQHLLLRFGIVTRIRERKTHVGYTAYQLATYDRQQILRFAKKIGFWPGSEKQKTLDREVMPWLLDRSTKPRTNFDTLPPEAWGLMRDAVHETGATLASLGIRSTQPSQSLPYSVAEQMAAGIEGDGIGSLVDGGPIWDVVESIEEAGEEDVYDLTVPGVHNFVANNIIIHNSTYARCGIILNVTPFEPTWEGQATLEISNTTPLPARIYSNEGIGQVVFLRASQECAISYADRKGKYQRQRGIVLPRIG